MAKKEMETIGVVLSKELAQTLREEAEKKGLSLSSYVRTLLLEAASDLGQELEG